MEWVKRNKWLVVSFLLLLVLLIVKPSQGQDAVGFTINNLKSVVMVLPPIFVLIGLMDVWVPKEVMVKFMGHRSGAIGALIALFIGTMGAGPLYVAFPVAALLVKKGARLAYVFLFLGAWTSVKLPLFMFEWASFGAKFTLIHVGSSLLVYITGSFLLEKMLSSETREMILDRAETMS